MVGETSRQENLNESIGENQNEMSEVERAAFELGSSKGENYGKDYERAWHSGSSLIGSPLGEQYMREKEELMKNMSEKEKIAFDKGYTNGERNGMDKEREWQSKQEK